MKTYTELYDRLRPEVVRWEHATFVLNVVEPFGCERSGLKPGRLLRKPRKSAPYSYGYAADGRLLIARESQFEFLHLHRRDAIERLMFDRTAIDWARKQRIRGDHLRWAQRINGRGRFTFRNGRLVRHEETRPGRRKSVETYEYDDDGRVTRVKYSNTDYTDELVYDATGQLIRVLNRYRNGKTGERFRRAPREDRFSSLLPELRERLVEQIPKVLAGAKIRKPAYCLALACNLEEAPYLLPPRLVVGLVADRDRALASGREFAVDDIWQADALPLFNDSRTEMREPALASLCKRANVAREDDRPILKMLRGVATALQRRGLKDALVCEPDFVVFAVDFGDESGRAVVKRTAPAATVRHLISAKML